MTMVEGEPEAAAGPGAGRRRAAGRARRGASDRGGRADAGRGRAADRAGPSRGGDARAGGGARRPGEPRPGRGVGEARPCAELQRAEAELQQHRAEEEVLARELVETEERLTETQRQTADALERAVARLEEVESRAAEAEARAEQAERLATLKAEEIERTEPPARGPRPDRRRRAARAHCRGAGASRRRQGLRAAGADRPGRVLDGPSEPPTARGGARSHLGSRPRRRGRRRPRCVVPARPAPLSLNAATYEDLRSLGPLRPAGRPGARPARAQRAVHERRRARPDPRVPVEFLDELKTRLVI